jgi:hypothetical protein
MTVLDDTPKQLEEIVREHLEWNRLPAMVTRQVKAGYGGVGAKCEVCGSEIELRPIEYEVMPTPAAGRLSFHLRCYEAWQTECVRRQGRKK